MLKKISSIVLVLVAACSLGLLLSGAVYAADAAQEKAVCEGAGGVYFPKSGCSVPGNSVTDTIRNVSNLLIFIIGIIAVIMIIIGGIRYATSGGDQAQVTSAKNTILYAVIGLVVALLAWGIASFVVAFLTAPPPVPKT